MLPARENIYVFQMVKEEKMENLSSNKQVSNSIPTYGKNTSMLLTTIAADLKKPIPIVLHQLWLCPKILSENTVINFVWIESFLPHSNAWQMSFPGAWIITGKIWRGINKLTDKLLSN